MRTLTLEGTEYSNFILMSVQPYPRSLLMSGLSNGTDRNTEIGVEVLSDVED